MKSLSCMIIGLLLYGWISAQPYTADSFPNVITSGPQGAFHVQGMAVDRQNGCIYLSFTDKLLKLDLKGHVVGSVTGLVGHLGDLTLDSRTGKIYGSLEYKDDAIGNGIRRKLGVKDSSGVHFYIAMFDGSQITRPDMPATDPRVLRTVHLQSVVDDYEAEVKDQGEVFKHRYGCSGIDGITIGPAFGAESRIKGKNYLYVAYGIYGDTLRTDNDNQVIVQFDYKNWWDKYGRPLTQSHPHLSGPSKPLHTYFVYTGNTTYGIQNLEYDAYTGNYYAAVYAGKKSRFPNYDLFVLDGHQRPHKGNLEVDDRQQRADFLSLASNGKADSTSGVRGWHFKWGSTGIFPLGDGYFYISHNGKSEDGQQQTTLYKYKWTGASASEGAPFTKILAE